MADINVLNTIKEDISIGNVKLIAVSKTKTRDEIMQVYTAGHKVFGENKVQELAQKYECLPKDIEWHMIGHLQSNKVKYIASFISLIHSIDSLKLLTEVNKRAKQHDRVINCLLQVHIALEKTKFGFDYKEIEAILSSGVYKDLLHVKIIGLMSIASFTKDAIQIRKEFKTFTDLFKEIKQDYFSSDELFRELSMGMSGDYKIAVEMGSTMLRIGSLIFGNR